MNRRARCLGLLLACAVLPACTTLTTNLGKPLPSEPIAIEPGTSELGQVLRSLGPPDRISTTPGGFAMLYERLTVGELQFGLSIPYSWLRYFKFAIGSAHSQRQELVLEFDEAGTLRAGGGMDRQEMLGRGTALQLIVAVVPTVDFAELRQPTDTNAFGRALLDRFPEALNNASSPETGRAGFELRGTPEGAGQRTLEMRSTRSVWRNRR